MQLSNIVVKKHDNVVVPFVFMPLLALANWLKNANGWGFGSHAQQLLFLFFYSYKK